MIITNKSIKALLIDVKGYNISYIMTRKVNQDVVETYLVFSKEFVVQHSIILHHCNLNMRK